jgi:hypothetical protein
MDEVVGRIAPRKPEAAPIDPAQRERIEALGYVVPEPPAN